MTDIFSSARELAARPGVGEIDVHRLAQDHRLPFAFSTQRGFFIHVSEEERWRAIVGRAREDELLQQIEGRPSSSGSFPIP